MNIVEIGRRYGLDVDRLESLRQAARHRIIQPDEVIYQEGAESDAFCFIESGQALVYLKSPLHGEEPVNVLQTGQFFGEIGLLEDVPRTASVRAIGVLHLFEIDRSAFVELFENDTAFRALIRRIGTERLLAMVPLFRGLGKKGISSLQAVVSVKDYRQGTVVFEEGDPADALYILVKGAAEISIRGADGHRVTISHLDRGDYFGELGLIESRTRTATVTTSEASRMLRLAKADFQKLLEDNASISWHMLKELSRRLRTTSAELAAAKSASYFRGMTIVRRPGRCIGCRSCELACSVSKSKSRNIFKAIYEAPVPVKRMHVRGGDSGSEPTIRPEHCHHCRDAPCVTACARFEAIVRDPHAGTIIVIDEKCVGCGKCARACPFDVISLIRVAGRKRRMALKCDYCEEHKSGPACVRSCPTKALAISLAPIDFRA